MTRQALHIAWASGRSEFVVATLLQVIAGGGIALLLLLGQQGLQALLELQSGQSLASIAPWAIAIAGVAGIQSFVTAVQRERQEVLGEMMQRHVEEHILEVAAAVDLLGFETPALHNRLQRMRHSGPQSLNVVFGLFGLIAAAIGVIAVLVTLITIQPLLIIMVSIVLVPAWLSASRRGEAFWRFFWRMTPRDRERQYLVGLLSDRDAAKEIRAFNLGEFLRARHRYLYDDRVAELQRVAAKQTWRELFANLGIAVGSAITLPLWMACRQRHGTASRGGHRCGRNDRRSTPLRRVMLPARSPVARYVVDYSVRAVFRYGAQNGTIGTEFRRDIVNGELHLPTATGLLS